MTTIEVLLVDGLMIIVGLGLALAGGLFTDRLRRDGHGRYKRRSTDK
jgi:hypothetical protein